MFGNQQNDKIRIVKDDYFFLKQAKTPDILRAKIEHMLESNNSPFKNVKALRDLFKRENTGHVDNLVKLLQLCGKAEMIDINHELKFRLRYLISNVLLYGNNKLD